MHARTSRRGWLATAAIAGAVAAAVVLPTATATAAPASVPAAAPVATAATEAASGNSKGTSKLSATAQAAARQAVGAAATTQQALEAYWTPARMKAAVPAEKDKDLIAASTRFAADQKAARKAQRTVAANDGAVKSFAGTAGKAVNRAKFTFAAEDGLQAAYNPNFPYYHPTARTSGKVFFTKAGVNYVCSGTIVNSEGKDTVWTAGHCVHGGQGQSWAYNWTFVPAYDSDLANPRPYGTWSAAYLTARTAWVNNSDFSQDMGVAVMNTLNGWHIVDYFGGQGLTANRGSSGVWENAFGYPAEYPYSGGTLQSCYGYTSPEWSYWWGWSQTVKIPCDLTRGSSGGGWLYGWNGSWGWLNGVNSRIDRISGPTIMLSPYFDGDALSLYDYTRYA